MAGAKGLGRVEKKIEVVRQSSVEGCVVQEVSRFRFFTILPSVAISFLQGGQGF
jgi:hypothetical protein